jgi:hypothetical protein
MNKLYLNAANGGAMFFGGANGEPPATSGANGVPASASSSDSNFRISRIQAVLVSVISLLSQLNPNHSKKSNIASVPF